MVLIKGMGTQKVNATIIIRQHAKMIDILPVDSY